ncbi:MAG: hypothetical protein COT73_04285 [Bdellovibrio sp. CG10_big_fil_rev_8_21_14_0_10_47_8]|nr:MAG: hypothetical protein COT73_04285 [Bdellovibrio sp. CG10_big_fil_rev_8_21_14_0_10_47_8]
MEQTIQDSVAQWEHASVQNFTADGLLYQKGDGEPTFVIVEFADYLCPHCKVAYPTLHAFTDAHPSSRLIFKPFPLDGKCNKAIPHAGDGYRCKLAALSLCSEQVGKKGWAAHQWIFDHQETLPGLGKWNDTVKEVAQELQLNEGDLTQCVDSDAIYDKIQASANEGAKAQVPGTPAIFVNNKSLPGGAFLPILQGLYTKVMSN